MDKETVTITIGRAELDKVLVALEDMRQAVCERLYPEVGHDAAFALMELCRTVRTAGRGAVYVPGATSYSALYDDASRKLKAAEAENGYLRWKLNETRSRMEAAGCRAEEALGEAV